MNSAQTSAQLALPGVPDTVDTANVVEQMVRRAASMGFESWWRRAESVGFCAHPIQLVGTDEYSRDRVVWTRCNNRRARICPSCSDLYARDTWQLVDAGTAGGHHDVPAAVADRPQVFVTLTAPSYGPVHSYARAGDKRDRVCRDHDRTGGYHRCPHGKPLWCSITHGDGDIRVGQPTCADCYDYTGHVLFTWHMPELWRRFTITLRRALRREIRSSGADPDGVRVSFIKVVELQARLIPHIHALIRLDPPADANCGGQDWHSPVTATELATIIQQAARTVAVTVIDSSSATATRVIRFGTQVDTQPIDNRHAGMEGPAVQEDSLRGSVLPGRRVARYLAKYVTKSLADVGIGARRISTEAIADLDVTEHVRAILTTISQLANRGLASIGRWLHTLGYRGHITSKSRRYSTTMTALREQRATWTREQRLKNAAHQHDLGFNSTDGDDLVAWEFDRAGPTSFGDRTLIYSAALQRIDARRIGLVEARRQARNQRGDPPGVLDG
ncbi:replication initiator [Mycobacterium kiyosense]|uniref:Plasmid replication initiator protein n=1 Tax=Mycobacterium kiyosense TaxID=2871094 RepID=A0AA37PWC4_9MYCO|nr:replication initiator [Mycobacterium kiyosense]GLB83128.1 putative plasmid replication initiator protein [Mycobacterium kiyosense]GLB96617.1 putative plasmid replication initiator protein [Mycobacterium kiyosense]